MTGRSARGVTKRICVEGTLVLETPAHFGNGDIAGLTDMPLLLDPLELKKPLLTGASISGALRAYVREFEHGYLSPGSSGDLADELFGRVEGQSAYASWLLVDDALGDTPGTELRDGVVIDAVTRTAEDGKKYDLQLLQAGTKFSLVFELLLTENKERSARLLQAFALALHGLHSSEIGLGMRKRRGYGQCRVDQWRFREYDLTVADGLIGWLSDDRSFVSSGEDIYNLLGLGQAIGDHRKTFEMKATFRLASSLLIRSGSGGAGDPDTVHLSSQRNGSPRPILSGTSLAGAIRARGLRIANTLWPVDSEQASFLINGMFGERIQNSDDKPSGSRVVTRESELTGTHDWVQSRVKIDRFTGGSFPTALFTEQPAFGGKDSAVTLHVSLRQPQDAEIGLLLLILKDLWTGDLPLGGESSVGRGRLQGIDATLTLCNQGKTITWRIIQANDRLRFDPEDADGVLETFVQESLLKYQMPEKKRRSAV